ncbi:Dyp-type peroxidase [Streptomyces sp. NPDC048297]|uniref:Dyp-type peroxidase n=1 Tax=Streptomyces sp. NPDC048297 TaxID=3365531 RepID=UPI003712E263
MRDVRGGREMLRRLVPHIASAADTDAPSREGWLSVALTFPGLRALGVPEAALAGFPEPFREGMAARADLLGMTGDSAPERWEAPLGTSDVHVMLTVISPPGPPHARLLEQAVRAGEGPGAVEMIHRQDAFMLPTEREQFGFRDGIANPAVEGAGAPIRDPYETPLKAGEFVLGHPDENGLLPPMPGPDILGRNGSYVAFLKLHQRVAEFRRYVRDRATDRDSPERLAAKMVGRWSSGAPLELAPDADDPVLGADPERRDAFGYGTDHRGLRCPAGSHIRRSNPRDAFADELIGTNRLHRILRRSTGYGPPLPQGVIEDDGADRGLVFIGIGAHLSRQFEFVQTQWINEGTTIGATGQKDPLIGANGGAGTFTVPQRPIRRTLSALPTFVVTRGGHYGFIPGLRALRWIADPDS